MLEALYVHCMYTQMHLSTHEKKEMKSHVVIDNPSQKLSNFLLWISSVRRNVAYKVGYTVQSYSLPQLVLSGRTCLPLLP